jgi:type III secretion protein J
MTRMRWSLLAPLALALSCSVPVAADLEETEANRIVVALEENGIAASKQADPASEGRWQVTVPRADASPAVRVLRTEGLPAPSSPGVLDALGNSSIVPSRTSEHAKLVAGTAGELERSLSGVDGMLSARVHLAIPAHDPWSSPDGQAQPTASVLLRHRGERAPLSADEVQRLVAGAIPGLAAEQVSVVTTAVPPRAANAAPPLASFGPITVTRSSLLPLRLLVAAAALLNLVLIAVVLLLYKRVRRTPSAQQPRPLEPAQIRTSID